jgi:hypothetical protein
MPDWTISYQIFLQENKNIRKSHHNHQMWSKLNTKRELKARSVSKFAREGLHRSAGTTPGQVLLTTGMGCGGTHQGIDHEQPKQQVLYRHDVRQRVYHWKHPVQGIPSPLPKAGGSRKRRSPETASKPLDLKGRLVSRVAPLSLL